MSGNDHDYTPSHAFRLFIKDWCRAFPGLSAYIDRLPDVNGTLHSWERSLARFPMVLLATVRDRILDGAIARIEPHEFPHFGLEVASRAQRILDDERRARERRENQELAGARGAAVRLVGTGQQLLVTANRARDWGAQQEHLSPADVDALVMAVVTLCDGPSDRERQASQRVVDDYGATRYLPAWRLPARADERRPLLQDVGEI